MTCVGKKVIILIIVYSFNFVLQEKERAKQNKKADKKMMKEKKFQQQQMELHMARELKKPVEGMKLHEEDRVNVMECRRFLSRNWIGNISPALSVFVKHSLCHWWS